MEDQKTGGDSIVFSANIYKVQTLVDGGIRISLDLAENAIGEAATMIECHRLNIPLLVTMKVESNKNYKPKQNGKSRRQSELETGGKRQSEWQTPEKPSAD